MTQTMASHSESSPRAAEKARLAAVTALDLFDTPSEKEFDEVVELATRICDTPIGVMSLVGSELVFHKSYIGFDMQEAPRNLSVCDHTIRQDAVLIVEDTLKDARFFENPYMTAPGGVRFYAGASLKAPTGERVGSLCVIDTIPRQLSSDQISSLQILARQIGLRFRLRAEMKAVAQMAKTLQQSERMFRNFLDALPLEAHLKDQDGRILYYNSKVAERFGIGSKDWIGKTSWDIWPAEIASRITEEDERVLFTHCVSESNIAMPGSDQSSVYWRSIKVPCSGSDGSTIVASVAIDITEDVKHKRELEATRIELEKANRELQTQSLTDELTQLANRRAFENRLMEMTALARRYGHSLSLLLLDIDHFKSFNDNFGHRLGDAVLRQIGDILNEAKRNVDIAARYGGEEFALLLPDTPAKGAFHFAGRIVERVRSAEWTSRDITVSVGCAEYHHNMSEDSFVQAADEALYAAKHNGRDRAELYSFKTALA